MITRAKTDVIAPKFKDHLNKGIVLRSEGKYQEALEHHLAAWEWIAASGSDLVSAKYQTGIGWCYENLGEHAKAYSAYQSALSYAKRTGDHIEQGIAQNNIAYLLIGLDRGDEAHAWLNQAEESFKLAGDVTNIARTQETRASLHQKEFAYRRAVKAICESTLTLIDGIEYQPLFESLTRGEQVIRAYRIQVALEMFPVAKAAKHLGMSRQNLERILKSEFPELEIYARRGEPRGKSARKGEQ